MSNTPYSRLSGGSNGYGSSSNGTSSTTHKHKSRRLDSGVEDSQAPWLTQLEYSVDPIEWIDDNAHAVCPLCKGKFTPSMLGASGRHRKKTSQ
jgi:hypothetical protein